MFIRLLNGMHLSSFQTQINNHKISPHNHVSRNNILIPISVSLLLVHTVLITPVPLAALTNHTVLLV